jgi:Uncharacterized homolog of phage Mu protein gp47
MYENLTYEVLLERMLARVGTDVDKSEGSLIFNALAPEAWELTQAYIAIEHVYDTTFADTAPREELIRRGKERGLEPDPATYAILKAVFNIDIEIGKRFSLDDLNYIVTEKIDTGIYKIQCETAGTAGNKKFGTLTPIEFIDGLENADITELLIPAKDEEETEAYRTKYFASFNSQAFGGNKADYIEKTESLQGVGRAKYYRATANRSFITIQIINSEYAVPSTELINLVQTTLDPTQNQGAGEGLAPIGHVVKVEGVVAQIINIASSFTLKAGYVWNDIANNVNTCLDNYFIELAKEWADLNNIIIRISQIEAKLLSVVGIEDIANTSINGSQTNLTLDSNAIPVRGNIIVN